MAMISILIFNFISTLDYIEVSGFAGDNCLFPAYFLKNSLRGISLLFQFLIFAE